MTSVKSLKGLLLAVVIAALAIPPGCGFVNSGIAKITCETCAGRGTCNYCGGTGKGIFLPCVLCNQTGRCPSCSGLGFKKP